MGVKLEDKGLQLRRIEAQHGFDMQAAQIGRGVEQGKEGVFGHTVRNRGVAGFGNEMRFGDKGLSIKRKFRPPSGDRLPPARLTWRDQTPAPGQTNPIAASRTL